MATAKKKAAKKAATKKAANKKPAGKKGAFKARVRMYRTGLGDCFLLTLPGKNAATPAHVLIDCGQWAGSGLDGVAMADIVSDIKATTGGRLDLLVATHEHWDHLSGFKQQRAVFDAADFKVGEKWFAWTESDDDLAKKLRKKHEASMTALRAALTRLQALAPGAAVTQSLASLLGAGPGLPAAGGGADPHEALDHLVQKQKAGKREFLSPGDVMSVPGTAAVKAYVLGPPRDETALHKDKPTTSAPETYPKLAAIEEATSHLELSLAAGIGSAGGAKDLAYPFEERFRKTSAEARRSEFFQRHYGFDGADDEAGDARAFRRIDHDWLDPSEALALAMGNYTNNTSLVLAFELAPGGDVLLFVADAQVGNWLSWDKVRFAPGEAPGQKVADLLARTVLYKVGHHGSENATLKEKGLERMTSGDLVAMIPTHEKWALARKPHPWRMPLASLERELMKRTKGRVLRVDRRFPKSKPKEATEAGWSAFDARVTDEKLYFEWELK